MNMRIRAASIFPAFTMVFCAWLLTGCASFQYVLVSPGNGQVIEKKPVRVDLSPVSYLVGISDKRLGIQINNGSDQPITLSGNRSYLVSPDGESHTLRGALIAPHSYVGVRIPPQRQVYRAYPTYGWGLGYGYPSPWYGGHYGYSGYSGYYGMGFYHDPFFYAPMDIYPVNQPGYWEWKQGSVRLLFSYQQGATNTFEHQFVIDRRQVK